MSVRDRWKIKFQKINQWNSRLAREKQPMKRPCVEHMTRSWRVMSGCEFRECFARKANARSTRKTICLAKSYVALSNALPTLHIPLLPINCNEWFSQRKPKQIHLRVRDCYTHNHLHIFLWFSSNSYLSISRSLRGC